MLSVAVQQGAPWLLPRRRSGKNRPWIKFWRWRSRSAPAACQCVEHGAHGAKHCARQWTQAVSCCKKKLRKPVALAGKILVLDVFEPTLLAIFHVCQDVHNVTHHEKMPLSFSYTTFGALQVFWFAVVGLGNDRMGSTSASGYNLACRDWEA